MALLISERRRALGVGMQVGRILPYAKRRMVGPFIFLDHMGPVSVPAKPADMDVLPHPHIGLSTLTYLYSGEIVHRDSLGTNVAIQAGAVNWMTAGRGITHSERFERAQLGGDDLHGVQAWVALPEEHEEMAPSFSHHAKQDLPIWAQNGVVGRLLAGQAYGLRSPVQTLSPLHYVHLELTAGSQFETPCEHAEQAVYVAQGAVSIAGTVVSGGQMLVLDKAAMRLAALTQATVMLLGGEPVGPRHIYWNFVSSRKERLEQAAEDWRAGRMKLPDGDDQTFIALPRGPGPMAPGFS